jgi:hypothetical protein
MVTIRGEQQAGHIEVRFQGLARKQAAALQAAIALSFCLAATAVAADPAVPMKRFTDGLPVCLALPPFTGETESAAILGALKGIAEARMPVDCVFGIGGGALVGAVLSGKPAFGAMAANAGRRSSTSRCA